VSERAERGKGGGEWRGHVHRRESEACALTLHILTRSCRAWDDSGRFRDPFYVP